MAHQTEARRTGEYIVSEANGTRSRDAITLDASVTALVAGTLLGRLASGKCVAYDPAGNDGRETAIGILYESTLETGADQPAVAVTCDAEVAAGRLTGLDTAARADLAALGIKVRD